MFISKCYSLVWGKPVCYISTRKKQNNNKTHTHTSHCPHLTTPMLWLCDVWNYDCTASGLFLKWSTWRGMLIFLILINVFFCVCKVCGQVLSQICLTLRPSHHIRTEWDNEETNWHPGSWVTWSLLFLWKCQFLGNYFASGQTISDRQYQ